MDFQMSDYNKCIKELEKISFKDFENQPLWEQEELELGTLNLRGSCKNQKSRN